MGNVIDIFSRQVIATRQDTDKNDAETEEGGKYIGNIGKKNATSFQQTVGMLEHLIDQMEALENELQEIGVLHLHNTDYILKLLKARDGYDHMKNELRVSENGDVWIVDAPFDNEAEQS